MWKRRMKCEIDLFRLSEELGHIIVIGTRFSLVPLYMRPLVCQLVFIISTTLLNRGRGYRVAT
jgi:hypothetical protein